MAFGTKFFGLMGALVLVLTVWSGLEVQWSKLDNTTATTVFLNLLIGVSVGLTEIAVGYLLSLHSEESK